MEPQGLVGQPVRTDDHGWRDIGGHQGGAPLDIVARYAPTGPAVSADMRRGRRANRMRTR
jgi:hypothetical protein